MKHFLVYVFMLFGIWLLLNGSFSPPVLITGAVVSCLVALATARNNGLFNSINLTPKALFHTLVFLFVFFREIVKSNLDVALRVASPSLPIHPGIVEVKTRLTSPLARLILTSSITLTPGTLTVESRGDSLFIHWIDVRSSDIEAATRAIVDTFEKHLEVMYG
jgi:multicomponent Na+:H+ antiporter subunit E